MIHLSEEQLFDFIDGVSFESKEREHLSTCAECKANLKEIEDFNKSLSSYAKSDMVEVDFSAEIMREIEKEKVDIFDFILKGSIGLLLGTLLYFLFVMFTWFDLSFFNDFLAQLKTFSQKQSYLLKLGIVLFICLGIEQLIRKRKKIKLSSLTQSVTF